jgi:ABC-2 type transport system ATP-binding protein
MIEADGLGKRYGTFTALKPLNLRVGRGEVFGFLGPNGAGKSTATKLFCTLLRPSEGRARVAGFDVTKEPSEVRRRIGYLPEKVPVYKPLTAREDLRYFGRLHGMDESKLPARIEAALERVGLANVEHKRSGTFSKGMTQRLGLARAILHEPEVLFFDEPATGLDPTGRRMIRELMLGLAREGRTIFLCSHDLGEVRAVANRIGFIRGGELVSVRGVGAAAEARIVELEVEGATAATFSALRGVPGVLEVEAASGVLRVRGETGMDRRALARAVQRSGATLLFVDEKEPSLDHLYQQYIERGPAVSLTPEAPEAKAEVKA